MVVTGAGTESLAQVIENFHSTNPESVFATTGYLEQHGNSLAQWNLLNPSGQVLMSGSNYTAYGKNGRMMQIAGFWRV